MKYRLSPINVFIILCTAILVASPLFSNSGFGALPVLIYVVPIFILGLVIDFTLQLFLRHYRWVVIIELVLIIIVLMLSASLLY